MHRNIIPTVKPTRCTNVPNLFILERYSTRFGRSFRPSSGIQDCTYNNRHLSNRYCCLLASGYPLASRQQYLFDKCLLLYVQSCIPDDGRKDRPKRVECLSKINKFDTLAHLVGFTIGITQIFTSTLLRSDTKIRHTYGWSEHSVLSRSCTASVYAFHADVNA